MHVCLVKIGYKIWRCAVNIIMRPLIIAIVEVIRREMALWSIVFGALFSATIPLHILHKELHSMAAELANLAILLYGAVKVLL